MEKPKNKREFTAYLLLSLAYSDAEFAPSEAQFIKQKLGTLEFGDVKKKFESHVDSEAIGFIKNGAERYLKDDRDHEILRKAMVDVIEVDHRVNQMEKVVFKFLDKLIK